MKILVCGGRNYCKGAVRWPITYEDVKDQIQVDYDAFYGELDKYLTADYAPLSLISGGARGADALAEEWANERHVPIQVFHAEWGKYGKRGGYMRNKKMLVEGKPDLVIAFRGGRGTANMIQIAEEAGVPVVQIIPPSA